MRAVRLGIVGVLFALIPFLSCVDGTSVSGPEGTYPTASLALVPVFPVDAPGVASAPVNVIRITARRLPENTQVAQVVVEVDPGATEWDVAIEVPLTGGSGTQYVLEIELVNRTDGVETVQWSGRTAPMSLRPGLVPQAREVGVSRGPLDNLAVTALLVQGPTQVPEQESFALTAQVTTSQAGSSPAVFWTALDSTIATIGGDGVGTARRAGTARIRAQAGPVSVTHTLTVTPVPTSVAVTPPTAELTAVGQVATFTAAVLDRSGSPIPGATVTWTGSDDRIALPLGGGRFEARGAGTVTVRATSTAASTLSATATLTVRLAPVEVVVSPAQATLTQPGQTTALTAQVYAAGRVPVFGVGVSWTSSNPAVATVDASGVVTAVAAGTAVITATTPPVGTPPAPLSASAQVTVALPPASVEVTPSSATLTAPGQRRTLQAVVRDVLGTPVPGAVVTWSSSNPATATVDASGVVTAVADGSAVITASSGGASGTATVVVDLPVGTVVVTPASVTLTSLGQQQALAADVRDAGGNSLTAAVVTWISSDPAVATVSGAGLVTAVAEGTAIVTATSKGVSGTASVTVDVAIGSVVVTPATISFTTLGQQVALTAVVRDAAGNVLPAVGVTWTSSNGLVATVTSAGMVTSTGAGSASITATAKGVSGSASVTVDLVIDFVAVEPAAATVGIGGSVTLVASAVAVGGASVPTTFAWASTAPLVATVGETGVVTGVAGGTAVITATAKGKTGTATITVVGGSPEPSFFETPGNTELVTGTYPRPTTAHYYRSDNAVSATPGTTLVPGAYTSTEGGQVEVLSDGSFSYTPPVGFQGTDQFTVTTASEETATVEVEVVGVIWYVGGSGAGTGLSDAWLPGVPGGGMVGAPGDVVYLYGATGTIPEGVTLQTGQKLVGENAGLDLPPWGVLHPAGATPVVTASGDAIVLADGVEVRGFAVVVAGGDGMVGTGVSGVIVDDVDVSGTELNGVTLTDATGTLTFTDFRIGGSGYYGFHVNGGDAVIDVALGGPIGIQAPGRHIVRVENTTGGSLTLSGGEILSVGQRGVKIQNGASDVTILSKVTVTNPANDGLSVQNFAGDVFLQELHAVVTGRSGIHLQDNTGTTTVASGTLNVTDAPGMDVQGGGALDLDLASVLVQNGAGTDGLHLESATGNVSIGLLDVTQTGGGTALYMMDAGTLTVSDPASSLLATTSGGMDVTRSVLHAGFASVEVNQSPADALHFFDASGSLDVASGSILDAAGGALDIDVGSWNLDFGASILGPAGSAVRVWNASGNYTFTGQIQSSSGGISMGYCESASFLFSGPVDLQTGGSQALYASYAGRLEMTGSPNVVLTTTAAPAVHISNTDIGPAGVTFRSVSMNGGTVGIQLNNTGSLGSFRVVGTGAPGSGGLIQNTSGNGVLAVDTKGLELHFVTFSNTGGHSIGGNSVDGFTFDGIAISSSGFRGITFQDAKGTGIIRDTDINGQAQGSIFYNTTGSLSLTVENSDFNATAGSTLSGALGFVSSGTASQTLTFDGLTVSGAAGRGLQIATSDNAVAIATVENSAFASNTGHHVYAEASVASSIDLVVAAGATFTGGSGSGIELVTLGSGQIRGEVSSSNFTSLSGDAVKAAPTGSSSLDLRVFDIGVDGVSSGGGVFGVADGASTLKAWVGKSTFTGTAAAPVYLQAGQTAGSTSQGSFHIHANDADYTGGVVGIGAYQGQNGLACVSVTGNQTSGGAAPGVGVGQTAGSSLNMKVEGLNGGAGTVTDAGVADGYLEDTNPSAHMVAASILTGLDGVAIGSCALPVAPAGSKPSPPAAHPQRVVADGVTPEVVVLTGSDAEGGALTFLIVTPPTLGSLGPVTSLGPNSAQVTYTPGGVGSDSFLFQVLDPSGALGFATVAVDNAGPSPVDIAYATVGNTELVGGGYGSPVGAAFVEDPANVFDPTPGLTADNAGPLTSTAGGQVTLAADGSFSYRPPRGFTGIDTFPVTVGAESATVTITVSGRVWYVDNRADGSGRSSSPYPTLLDASLASADGDVIYVFHGDGTPSGMSSGIVLKPGQKLIGEGAGLDLPGYGPIAPAGSKPILDNASPAPTVTLASDNTVAGLLIHGTGGFGIYGSALGAASFDDVDIANADGGVFLDGATGSATFVDSDITVSEATGLQVAGGSPDLTFGGSMTVDVGYLLDVSGTLGGTLTFTGTFSNTGAGVFVAHSAGSVVMSSLDVLSPSTAGINLSNNTGSYTFNDVHIDGTTGTAIDVFAGAPTVVIDVRPASVSNGSGRVLSVESTTGGSVALTGGPIHDSGGLGFSFVGVGGPVTVDNAVTVTNPGPGALAGVLFDGGASNVTFADLTVVTSAGVPAIRSAAGTGVLTVASGSVTATGAPALDVDGGTVDLTLASLTADGAAGGHTLVGMASSASSTVAVGTLSLTAGTGDVPLDLDDAGLFTVSAGSISATDGPGVAINATGLDVVLSTLSSTSGTHPAILISGSTGAFGAGGGALVTSGSVGGVVLTSNSDLDFTYDGTIDNSGGPAVSASGNTAESSTFDFGGRITDPSGRGIQLTGNYPGVVVSFTGNLDIDGYDYPAILATGQNVVNVAGGINSLTSANAPAIVLGDMRGTSTFQNVTASSGSGQALALVQNINSGTVNVQGSTFTGNSSSPTVTASALGGASLTLNLNGVDISGAINNPGLTGSAASASVLDLTVDGASRFDGNQTGLSLVAADDARLHFDIDGNQITNSAGSGIAIESASLTAGVDGRVRNNTINGFGTDGVLVRTLAGGVGTVEVSGNTVTTSEFSTQGIAARSGTGVADTGNLHLTLLNNAVEAAQYGYGLDIQSHGTAVMCLNVQGNAITDPSGYGQFGFGVWQAESSVFQLERFTGSPTVVGEVAAHLTAENPSIAPFAGGTGPVAVFIDSSGFAPVAAGTCRVPTP